MREGATIHLTLENRNFPTPSWETVTYSTYPAPSEPSLPLLFQPLTPANLFPSFIIISMHNHRRDHTIFYRKRKRNEKKINNSNNNDDDDDDDDDNDEDDCL